MKKYKTAQQMRQKLYT